MATAGQVLSELTLCASLGLVGQGIRASIGLKNANALNARMPDQQTIFDASYFLLSLMIGAIVGIVAGFVNGLGQFTDIDIEHPKALIAIIAASYAGADFIENALSLFIPGTPTTAPVQSAVPPAPVPSPTPLAPLLGVSLQASTMPVPAGHALGPTGAVKGLGRELVEATKYKSFIEAAAQQYGLEPTLIYAIGSRESAWGLTLKPPGPEGTGDFAKRDPVKWGYALPPDGEGWGRGLMQIDYQQEFAKSGNWQDPQANINHGCKEISDNIAYYRGEKLSGLDAIRAGVAAYNCGRGNVNKALEEKRDVDVFTAGHDYSRDVLQRQEWFARQPV